MQSIEYAASRLHCSVGGSALKPNDEFRKQPKSFWATVRLVSQVLGYTEPRTGRLRTPSFKAIAGALASVGLNPEHVLETEEVGNSLGLLLESYFVYRAHVLYDLVRPALMTEAGARGEFERVRQTLSRGCPLPMNKQKGPKRAPAYFTCIINILLTEALAGLPCDFDPRKLTTITRDAVPLRTLARRVDGAFPSPINPIAVWEIKEYYYTTTFGSRVADGVYESLLDGLELEELRENEGVDVLHYLMVDAYETWWNDGKSYLCRMVDMLHMEYVDEVLFGREVLERLPKIALEWRRRFTGISTS